MEPIIESEDEFMRITIVSILTEWMEHDPAAAERWSRLTREDPAQFSRFNPLTGR